MNIISIDIGEKHFAYCFIKVTVDATGCVFEVEDVKLHNVIEKPKQTNGVIKKPKQQTIVESCCKISNILYECDNKISSCMYILIEQQMVKNARAQRVAQHVWSYLHTKYILKNDSKAHPQIVSVSSSLKTKTFIKEPLDNKQRKKWVTDAVLTKNIVSLAKSHNIVVNIPDNILETIKQLIKQDDVCDTIVQSLVFLIKNPKVTKNLI
jgi:hypothetical protein